MNQRKREQLAHAEYRASHWLAEANIKREAPFVRSYPFYGTWRPQ